MSYSGQRDSGQAFPAYVAVVAGVLFLAFAYFVVGQAGVTRNGAQTAADASALAAAQDGRDQLRDGWLDVLLDPAQWDRYLRGEEYDELSACQRADSFAAKNSAEIPMGGCSRLPEGGEGFRVTVLTTNTVGRSIIPGTESRHATASAEAVIEPRCTFEAPEPTQDPTPPEPTEDPTPPEPTQEPTPTEEGPIVGLVCGNDSWEIDPEHPTLPDAVDLFTVRLSD
ncbi:pilus assembly protein TadG-related protein [Streptomyces sp. NPDC056891]|uniref:pilus assembly protein TadG-related protein n=1 Tax=Streptomyces sp. NPDC056891 TaxID=3345961 RepID=UPI003681000A